MAIVLHGGSCSNFNHNHSHGNVKCNHSTEIQLPGSLEVSSRSPRNSLDFNNNDSNHGDLIIRQNKQSSHQGSNERNLNVEAALLHVLGDFLQSIGVLVAAIIIKINVSFEIFHDKLVDVIDCLFVFYFVSAQCQNN